MEFNLQTFLRDMRREQQADHTTLDQKLDKVLEKVSEHETRLTVVENTRKVIIWIVAAMITGGIGVLAELLLSIPKH